MSCASTKQVQMSGEGAPQLRVDNAQDVKVAVVASQWHAEIMQGLLDGAQRALRDAGVRDATVVRVPGVFELTVAASRLCTGQFDALVALGVVIRGGTPHFEYVCQAATSGLTAVAQRTGVPIGFGVLTCDDEDQARDRAGLAGSREDKGYEAAVAAIATALTLAPWQRCG
jgi:6,7-dimethyl-8-ribityllumazine synthase